MNNKFRNWYSRDPVKETSHVLLQCAGRDRQKIVILPIYQVTVYKTVFPKLCSLKY